MPRRMSTLGKPIQFNLWDNYCPKYVCKVEQWLRGSVCSVRLGEIAEDEVKLRFRRECY